MTQLRIAPSALPLDPRVLWEALREALWEAALREASHKTAYCIGRPPAKQAQARPRRREGELAGAGRGSDRSTSTRLACEAGAAASAAASAAAPAPAAGLAPTVPALLAAGATAAAGAAGSGLPRAAISVSAPRLPAALLAAPPTVAAGTPSGMAGRWVLEEGLVRPLRSRLRGTGGQSARRRRRRIEARSRLMLRGWACERVRCAESMPRVDQVS